MTKFDLTDHLIYHARAPRPDCDRCREKLLASSAYYTDRGYCPSSVTPADEYERLPGNGAWARTTCPTCGRRVSVSRATRRFPWAAIARHLPKSR